MKSLCHIPHAEKEFCRSNIFDLPAFPYRDHEQALPENCTHRSCVIALPACCSFASVWYPACAGEFVDSQSDLSRKGWIFASWLLSIGWGGGLHSCGLRKGENTIMPVLSASQAVYPLLRSLFPPNIRLSMLWKSNRVNWLCWGMREAHGKDNALLPRVFGITG